MAKGKNLIIIFTRNPELGKVKTRLAKTIGDKSALNIYTFLLNHTETTIRNIDSDKAVYYSIKIRRNDIWNKSIYQTFIRKRPLSTKGIRNNRFINRIIDIEFFVFVRHFFIPLFGFVQTSLFL